MSVHGVTLAAKDVGCSLYPIFKFDPKEKK